MRHEKGQRRINGLDLAIHRYADEGAPPTGLVVLMLHGYLDTGSSWDLVATPLARAGHEVIAPDLRGFGASEGVGAGGYYHFPDYVADVSALVDDLAPARLAIVGHSMGGTVAAIYAGARPERVERLALLEGIGTLASTDQALHRMRAWLRELPRCERKPRELESLDAAVARLAHNHPRVSGEMLASRAALLTTKDAEGRLVWAYDPLHRTTSPMPFDVGAFKSFLREIACPTLFVSGGPAGWHPPDEDERLACIRDLERALFPAAGHMLHWTVPAELAARLLAFLGTPA